MVSSNFLVMAESLPHSLIRWPLDSKQVDTLIYHTTQHAQCKGMQLTFYIIQVMWPFDAWK